MMNGRKDGMSMTEAVADFAVGLRYEAIPEAARSAARILTADHLACAVGGSRTPLARSVAAYVRLMGGTAICPVPGTDILTSPALAAFAGASFANALDYDDTGSRGHPGASIIPPVLALAEFFGLSGKAALTAIVVGYEVNDRVARATLPSPERYAAVHANGSIQALGVAAACGRLLELSREAMLNCIGIAGAMAPVPHAGKFGWEDKSIPSIKDNVALPAENGVRAALLAREGYEGSESILAGAGGFGAMLGSDRCDAEVMCDFSRFSIVDVCLKPYPCCRWIHPALDALSELMTTCAFGPAETEAVRVWTTPPVAARFGRRTARTFLDMEFSTPLALALRLHGVSRAEWFEERHWNSPAIRDVASRVTLEGDETLWRRFLELKRQSSRVPARLEVHLRDGRTLERLCDLASGSPEKPLSAEERRMKWLELLEPQQGRHGAESLLEAALRLDHLERVEELGARTRCGAA